MISYIAYLSKIADLTRYTNAQYHFRKTNFFLAIKLKTATTTVITVLEITYPIDKYLVIRNISPTFKKKPIKEKT